VNPQLLFDAVVIAGMAWFWLRRARPVLLAVGAQPMALRLGLAATLFAITAVAVHLVASATGNGEAAAGWLRLAGGFVWIVVVGLGYPQYHFLRHATGTERPGKGR
jgi:membrane-bound metal-dependent hydrolase YbcI (DUF457 family)